MNTSYESVPAIWTAFDEDYFRVAADVFAPDFLWGASALLASYDPESALDPSPAVAPTESARTEPTASWPLAA
jgi:hypothetical protein